MVFFLLLSQLPSKMQSSYVTNIMNFVPAAFFSSLEMNFPILMLCILVRKVSKAWPIVSICLVSQSSYSKLHLRVSLLCLTETTVISCRRRKRWRPRKNHVGSSAIPWQRMRCSISRCFELVRVVDCVSFFSWKRSNVQVRII